MTSSVSYDLEEVKVEPVLKRRNSRFEEDTCELHFRPEFGTNESKTNEKMWELMSSYIGSDQRSIQRSIINHVEYTLARTRFNFDNFGAYQAASFSIRDRLVEAWNDTQ